MAVDLGEARTGIAVCDRTEFLATPVGIIEEKNRAKLVEKIVYAVSEFAAELVVIGYPRNMDGSEGRRAEKCAEIAGMLKNILSVDVVLWDERQTTIGAARIMNENDIRGEKRKQRIDGVAAALILENYLSFRHNTAEKSDQT